MSNWQRYTQEDQLVLLQTAANLENINEIAVEKDWWVSITLKALFQTSCASHLLFKGGTSLSKGWELIERFSEDIDLAIHHTFFGNEPQNKSQLKSLRKKSRKYVHEVLSKELGEQLTSMGITNYKIENITTKITAEGITPIDSNVDPTIIHVNYDSILESSNSYIPSRIKIEISCLSMDEPCEIKEISSLINKYFPGDDDVTVSNIKTVLPSRTFLEKAFLLNEEFQKDNPRRDRMSRHLYDLEKLMDTNFGIAALNDSCLYEKIVKHRSFYYDLPYVDYQKHHPSIISFIPPASLQKDWELDYREMKSVFIYGQALSFEELIARMEELKLRFKTIQTKENLLE